MTCIIDLKIDYVDSEIALLTAFVSIVKTYDPDILCGFEIQLHSIGYIIERASIVCTTMILINIVSGTKLLHNFVKNSKLKIF